MTISVLRPWWLAGLFLALACAGQAAEEIVPIFGGRRVAISPPEGFRSELGRDAAGRVVLRLADAMAYAVKKL